MVRWLSSTRRASAALAHSCLPRVTDDRVGLLLDPGRPRPLQGPAAVDPLYACLPSRAAAAPPSPLQSDLPLFLLADCVQETCNFDVLYSYLSTPPGHVPTSPLHNILTPLPSIAQRAPPTTSGTTSRRGAFSPFHFERRPRPPSRSLTRHASAARSLRPKRNVRQAMAHDLSQYAIVQKEGLGLDKCIETAKARMARYQVRAVRHAPHCLRFASHASSPLCRKGYPQHAHRAARAAAVHRDVVGGEVRVQRGGPGGPGQVRGGRGGLRVARLPRLRRGDVDAV